METFMLGLAILEMTEDWQQKPSQKSLKEKPVASCGHQLDLVDIRIGYLIKGEQVCAGCWHDHMSQKISDCMTQSLKNVNR